MEKIAKAALKTMTQLLDVVGIASFGLALHFANETSLMSMLLAGAIAWFALMKPKFLAKLWIKLSFELAFCYANRYQQTINEYTKENFPRFQASIKVFIVGAMISLAQLVSAGLLPAVNHILVLVIIMLDAAFVASVALSYCLLGVFYLRNGRDGTRYVILDKVKSNDGTDEAGTVCDLELIQNVRDTIRASPQQNQSQGRL